jgi:hypothetical protein
MQKDRNQDMNDDDVDKAMRRLNPQLFARHLAAGWHRAARIAILGTFAWVAFSLVFHPPLWQFIAAAWAAVAHGASSRAATLTGYAEGWHDCIGTLFASAPGDDATQE